MSGSGQKAHDGFATIVVYDVQPTSILAAVRLDFEEVGVGEDVVQSHLVQIVAALAGFVGLEIWHSC